ncbi:hypothetical protein [Natronosalvus amylolyticus]|uniref:hypothetical protein n=1 Tax=Natronosalvus amylolyticus TaxID=2961994 RepID=UPI0020C95C19|nr:hypothetical protein [Natronosalvus amylolyticus]
MQDEIDDGDELTDESMSEDILTGESHLEPRYMPNWGDGAMGRVHLEGELEFNPETPARQVADALWDVSEQIGAVVSHTPKAGTIRCYPWNGPGHFRLNYDAEDRNARVASITVFDGAGEPASHISMDDLIVEGERATDVLKALEANMKAATEESDNGSIYRITTDGLEPVTRDEVGF